MTDPVASAPGREPPEGDRTSGPPKVPTAKVPSNSLTDIEALGVGIFGLAFFVIGTFAVFRVDKEAGPVALLGLGLVFFVIGLARQIPTKLSTGTASFEFPAQAIGEAFAEVAGQLPADRSDSLVLSLEQLRQVSPEAAAIATNGLNWEVIVRRMLDEAVDTINDSDLLGYELLLQWEVRVPPPDGYGRPLSFDGVISSPVGDVAIAITHLSSASVSRRLTAWTDYQQRLHPNLGMELNDRKHGLLVIARSEEQLRGLDVLPSSALVSFATVTGSQDQDDLNEVIGSTFHMMLKWH